MILGTSADSEPHPGTRRSAVTGRAGMTARWMRVTALVLGVLALAAVLTVGTVIAIRGPSPAEAGSAGTAPGGSTVTGTRPVRPYPSSSGSMSGPGGSGAPAPPSTTPLRPGSPARPPGRTSGPADAPGGVAAARDRVAGFVAALNAEDFDRANSYLCQAMAGRYDRSSLEGIRPGSLGVGGVIVQGTTGSAVVTYQPSDGSPEAHALFSLTVEHNTWMVCKPN